MSREIHRQAEKEMHTHADEAAEQFSTTIMHNRVHEQVSGHHSTDDPLAALLDAKERAYALSERDDVGDATQERGFSAGEVLGRATEDVVDEQIARACADVILDGGAWTDAWDEGEIHAAQAEAREWVGDHLEATERAGVLEAVREKAVEEW